MDGLSKPQTPQPGATFDVHRELSMLDVVIYSDLRALIPIALRKRVLDLAHHSNCGVVKLKQRCRVCVWWLGIDHDVSDFVVNCASCITSGKV